MEPIRVVIAGALGKVGSELVTAVQREPDLCLVGAVEVRGREDTLSLPDGSLLPMGSDANVILERTRPRVLVDFTRPDAVMLNVRAAFKHHVSPVVGTTGLSAENLLEIRDLCAATGTGAVVASNFALGAVLLMHFARIAARYFDHAEIIELHHDQKADAPSGTALTTARLMAEAHGGDLAAAATSKQTLEGTRGGTLGGVHIHSVRLPGLVAHQEVIFGGLGQTLTIRHDSISRESFVPGGLLAIREVVKRQYLVNGLEDLLGL
ncbi:MAG: 4-hydroxy-tetrahydrodipicolinate reductase [Chloroflexota bacterium]|nr:4-hydroxy-tetrahydrodipicolinate reductase [Chloroflexota bacterium]